MKLTKSMGNAFVNAVMRDTPDAEAATLAKMKKLVMEVAIDRLPPKVKAAYKVRPDLIRTQIIHLRGTRPAFYGVPGEQLLKEHVEQAGRFEELMRLEEERESAVKGRKDLRRRLEAVAGACTTVKQLADALPELTKYLPDEVTRTKNLPAVTGLVSDLQKSGLRLDDSKGEKQ